MFGYRFRVFFELYRVYGIRVWAIITHYWNRLEEIRYLEGLLTPKEAAAKIVYDIKIRG